MPDKNLSSAKCHICGQKVPFTYGNPKELIQHMLGCHEHQENSPNCNPSCFPNNKPCVRIVDCPNKLAKCTTCGGRRQTAGKSATVYDLPKDAPRRCTICVNPAKDVCKPDCPKRASNDRRSSIQNDQDLCKPDCPNKRTSNDKRSSLQNDQDLCKPDCPNKRASNDRRSSIQKDVSCRPDCPNKRASNDKRSSIQKDVSCKPDCPNKRASNDRRSSIQNDQDLCRPDCPNKSASNNRRSSNQNVDLCRPDCPNKRASIKSGDATCLPNCPNKSSSRIDLGDFTGPIKLRIRCRSCDNKSTKSQEKNLGQNNTKGSLNQKNSPTDKNWRSPNLSSSSVAKQCPSKRCSSSIIETNRKLSPSALRKKSWESDKIQRTSSGPLNPADKNKECCLGKCKSFTASEKNRRLSNTSPAASVCNKTVCFANNVSGEPKSMQYSPCNLRKRRGTKEMYKTTLETWTAGCGSICCPKCQRKVVPLIRKKKNKITFSSVGASLLVTCWPFCFLIPMLHNCSVDLYCPCCKHKLGVYNSSTGKTTSVCCKENASNT